MVWKALEALGMLWKALGRLDVNTVCPLPGSWINHVVCMFTCFSEDEVTFGIIFTGFAESCLWECRVFSFKIARISQTSRVFLFTFVPAPHKSHDLRVNLLIFVWLFV